MSSTTPSQSPESAPKDFNREQKELLSKLKTVTDRMKRPSPTTIKLANGREMQVTDEFLARLSSGILLFYNDWRIILELLIHKHFKVHCPVGGEDMKNLKKGPGEKIIWILCHKNSSDTADRSSFLVVPKEVDSEFNIISVREIVHPLRSIRAPCAEYLGIENYKVSLEFHQELPIEGSNHQPFQDAILFDMILDIAMDTFKPHTRTISDGPRIQLEIALALEQELILAEAMADIALGKRKSTVMERINSKRAKTE